MERELSVKGSLDQLLTYKLNMKNDYETLNICLNSLTYDTETPENLKNKLKMLILGLNKKLDS